MDPTIQAALASWRPPIATIATLLAIAAIYVRGFARLHRQMPTRFARGHLACFLGGIAALGVAIASPLEAVDEVLLQVHMTQHLLLMLLSPVLLLAGAPAIPLLRGLHPRIAKIVGQALRARPVRRAYERLTDPLICWLAFVLATWIWHLPGPFQLALRSDGWHFVEHTCFFTTALMFWYPVVQPWPSVARWTRWAMLPYLLLAEGQNTILSALFVFSNRLLYPYYASAPRVAGFTPLGDQVVAGVLMWVPGSIFYLIPAATIMFQMLAPQNLSSPLLKKDGIAVRSRAIQDSAAH
jgi:putative membrane protein